MDNENKNSLVEDYKEYLNRKGKNSFWRKAKQIEFSYKNSGEGKILEYLTDKFGNLTTRNSMNLRILGLVKKTGIIFNHLEITEDGHKFISPTFPGERSKILSKNLLNFSLNDSDINKKLKIDIKPLKVLNKILAEVDSVTFTEYKLFICWIEEEQDVRRSINFIKGFRSTISSEKTAIESILKDKINMLAINDFDDDIKRLFDMFTLIPFIKQKKDNGIVTLHWADDEYDFPLEENFKPSEINLELADIETLKYVEDRRNIRNRPTDYIARQITSVHAGKKGEQIVYDFEKQTLIDAGKVELASKVKIISEESDSYGYDILSYNEDGSEKHIEVKATKSSPNGSFQFYISEHEKEVHESDEKHIIYIVFGYQTKEPKIFKLGKLGIITENKKLIVKPTSYIIKAFLD